MATKKHSQGTRVYVGAYDWSCQLNTAEIQNEKETTDITVFCDSGKVNLFGKQSHTLTCGGFSVFGEDTNGDTVVDLDKISFDQSLLEEPKDDGSGDG